MLDQVTQNELFKLFKVDLLNVWEFWADNAKCRLNQCPIDEEQKLGNSTHIKTYIVDKSLTRQDEDFTNHIPIEHYNSTHNGEEWMMDEHLSEEGIYVDLRKNPERFSGYNGSIIWEELYQGNLAHMNFSKPGVHEQFLYRIISGVQVNINMHISHYYLDDIEEVSEMANANFYQNYQIYYERIGAHPDRIQNLFYTYVFLIHTIDTLSDLLPKYTYDTESKPLNENIQNKMVWFGHYINGLLDPELIESDLFINISKSEFVDVIKPKFQNITMLLDWIGWNICKLNAKLQFTGLAAMFKILFSKDGTALITENELTGLMNLAHRLSNSIKWYREYRKYEEQESFYKTILFAALVALTVIVLIIAIFLLFYKRKAKDESEPLRDPNQPMSAK